SPKTVTTACSTVSNTPANTRKFSPPSPRSPVHRLISKGSIMAHRPLIFFDPRMLDHQPGEFHPEIPERLQAIAHMLDELPPDLIERHTCIPASRADIERIHDASYIDLIDSLRGKPAHLD